MEDYRDAELFRLHQAEQQESAFRRWARCALWFRRGAIAEGATQKEALRLTAAFLVATMHSPEGAPPEE